MRKTFMPGVKSEEELRSVQLEGLKWTVNHAYEGSSFYRRRLKDAGIQPLEISFLEDLGKLPFTTAEDLREGYPFPLLSVPLQEVIRIHASSGTTGKRKVLCYTEKDIQDWADMFARCYEMAGLTPYDRVQVAVGYGLWTEGVGFQMGRSGSGPWRFLSGRETWTCIANFWWTCRPRYFAAQPPWACSWPRR